MNPSGDSIKAFGEALQKLISSETVIGEPIEIGDVTLVPVIDVLFGFASRGMAAQEVTSLQNLGIGSGARISPRAVIVVRLDQVEVYPLTSSGPLERILDRLPVLTGSIAERIRDATSKSSPTGQHISAECAEGEDPLEGEHLSGHS